MAPPQTRLTNNGAVDSYPAFSPDGSKILFTSDRDGNSEIYSMNADGSGQTNLTNNEAADYSPILNPTTNQIGFSSDREDGDFELYLMNSDGSSVVRLADRFQVLISLLPSVPTEAGSHFHLNATGILKSLQ